MCSRPWMNRNLDERDAGPASASWPINGLLPARPPVPRPNDPTASGTRRGETLPCPMSSKGPGGDVSREAEIGPTKLMRFHQVAG